MKPLPKIINKSKMVELYIDQYTERDILIEIRSFQEQLSISKNKGILDNRVKKMFFERFGLPTGYEMTEETMIPQAFKI